MTAASVLEGFGYGRVQLPDRAVRRHAGQSVSVRDKRRRSLSVGDRVRVSGGYDMDPKWLVVSRSGYVGTVVDFIPGQNDQRAAVVALDEELVLPEGAGAAHGPVRGMFLVLTLGHLGTDWVTPSPRVHVELCEAQPGRKTPSERAHGSWVESHATCHILWETRQATSLPKPADPSPWP